MLGSLSRLYQADPHVALGSGQQARQEGGSPGASFPPSLRGGPQGHGAVTHRLSWLPGRWPSLAGWL